MRKEIAKSYEYIEKISPKESETKQKARTLAAQLGLAGISLSSVEANLVRFLCQLVQPEKILEIGTLTGLSALYFLENLSDKVEIWTIEKSQQHAEMAAEVLKTHIEKNRCHLLVGDAREELKKLENKIEFDVVFIDGNKAAYKEYFDWAIRHVRIGGLIIADNVFLSGAVWGDQTNQKFNQKQIGVMQNLNSSALNNEKLFSVIIPTEEGLLVCQKLLS
jgi:predicted O-methyltransferase YrrM